MTQDYYKSETTKRYDIPLTHLDYSYIRDCTDVKELEKILRILRSGDEGHYPELEKEAETRLEKLCPKSRVLRKDNPALRPSDLDRSEQENLKSDLETWKSDMELKEQGMGTTIVTKGSAVEEEDSLPPVRSAKVISVDGKVKETAANDVPKNKKAMPRSYKEWDKFDIDKELEKAEEDTSDKKPTPVPSSFKPDGISSEIDTKGMSEEEKTAKATREKDKGNEAFRSHDWEESILYYSRSISIAPLTATYNNRALAYLRLSKWVEAIDDCNYVLKLEPENIKALLRRASAYKGMKDFAKANPDLELVLQLESHNKTAQDMVKEISDLQNKAKKQTKETKEKGRRMVIEEVDGSEEEEDEECEEIIVEKADHESKPTAVVNGFSEDAKSSGSTPPVVTELKTTDPAAEEASSAAEETSQKPPNTNTESTAHKNVKAEEEVSSVQNSESNSSSQKPKLVATNIQSENSSSTQNTKAEKSSAAQEKKSSEGSGDVDQPTVNSTEKVPSRVSDIGDAQKEPTEVEEEEEDSAAAAAGGEEEEAEAEHVQPVLVQKALPPVEAALREKGNNFFRTGQYSEAIEIYQKIIDKLEKVPEQVVNLSLMYSNRAACYLKIGDCQAAIRDCNASLELVPHSVKPLLRKAAAYETLERYHHAYVDFKHVLSVDSSVDQAHQGASRCQNYLTNLHGQQWRNKLPPLKRFSRWEVPLIIDENCTPPPPPKTASPSAAAAAAAAAATVVSAASSSKAASSETKSSRETPAVVKDTRPQRQEAEKKAPQPKAPSPEEEFEATKAQGNSHVQKGEYEAAVQCYSQCLRLFSNRAAVFTNRALCYLKLNEAQKAEQDCSTALALESNNCKAFYRRALARKAQKHYKDSLQDLLLLLRLDSSNTAAKKEMEIVKGLYKEEYDQLKAQPAAGDKKKAPQPEKKRKRMKIEEVEEDSDTEEKPQPPSVTKPKASGAPQRSPSSTPSHSGNGTKPAPAAQPSAAPDNKHANARTAESRKPGRGKSKKGSSVKETSMGLPVTPTTSSTPKIQGKITPFEFIQHWNSLKQAKDIQPYVQLLEQISPDDLPGVISNKLDGHMLSIITRCAAHDAQTGEVERAYSILSNIRQVPRFSTVKMFLSNKEKQDIRKVLESSSILGSHSVEEVTTVRKDYGLK